MYSAELRVDSLGASDGLNPPGGDEPRGQAIDRSTRSGSGSASLWRRAQADPDGQWWLDRSSRPHRSPTRTRRKLERKVLSLRRNKKLGPARIAGRLEMPPSTVHAVLVRNQVSRLAWMDRPTGRVVRRYEHKGATPATWSTWT